jgi:hypothetical protein
MAPGLDPGSEIRKDFEDAKRTAVAFAAEQYIAAATARRVGDGRVELSSIGLEPQRQLGHGRFGANQVGRARTRRRRCIGRRR